VLSLTVLAPAWVDGMPQDALAEERQRTLKADRDLFALALKAAAATVPDDAFWQRLVTEGYAELSPSASNARPRLHLSAGFFASSPRGQ
jgi:hypothetical protein